MSVMNSKTKATIKGNILETNGCKNFLFITVLNSSCGNAVGVIFLSPKLVSNSGFL